MLNETDCCAMAQPDGADVCPSGYVAAPQPQRDPNELVRVRRVVTFMGTRAAVDRQRGQSSPLGARIVGGQKGLLLSIEEGPEEVIDPDSYDRAVLAAQHERDGRCALAEDAL